MNGKIGELKNATEQAYRARVDLFTKVKQIDDRVDSMALSMVQIATLADEMEKVKDTVNWVNRTRNRVAGVIAGLALAGSAAGLAIGDFLRGLFRAAS